MTLAINTQKLAVKIKIKISHQTFVICENLQGGSTSSLNNNFNNHLIGDFVSQMYQQDILTDNSFAMTPFSSTFLWNQDIENDYSFAITQPSSTTIWNRYEDKLFELSLITFPDDSPNRWQKIASQLPGKSDVDVREHYEALVHDVFEIDSGRVELPCYADDLDWHSPSRILFAPNASNEQNAPNAPMFKHVEPERKRGMPWTEEEHKLFLIGLKKFGKGDWRSISRNVVVTRTATQVASHAQKYFLRQTSVKKERKRSSIHDITTVDNPSVPLPSDPNWISSTGCTGPQQQLALQQFPHQGDLLGYQNYDFLM